MILAEPVSCRMPARAIGAVLILALLALPGWSADPPPPTLPPATSQAPATVVPPPVQPPSELGVPATAAAPADEAGPQFEPPLPTEQQAAAFSPDGKLLAISGVQNSQGQIAFVDASTGRLVQLLKQPADPRSLAFFGDGKFVAVGSADGSIRLLAVDSGMELKRLEGHRFAVRCLAFSGDGKTLASAADQEVVLWDLASGKRMSESRQKEQVLALAISPDGQSLAVGGGQPNQSGFLAHLDRSGKLQAAAQTFDAPVLAVAFSPDGQSLAFGSSERCLRVQSLAPIKLIDAVELSAAPRYVAFSPDGRHLAASTDNGRLVVLRFQGQKLVEVQALTGSRRIPTLAAFSPDGALLYMASEQGTLMTRRLNLATQQSALAVVRAEDDELKKLTARVKQLEAELARSRSAQPYPAKAPASASPYRAPSTSQPSPPAETPAPADPAAPAAVPNPSKPTMTAKPRTSLTPPVSRPNESASADPYVSPAGSTSLFGGVQASAGIGAHLDLVNLATTMSDASGNLRIAMQRLKRVQALRPSSAVSASEVDLAEAEADNANRKVKVLREIAQAAMEAAELEVEICTKSHQSGIGTQRDLQAAQSKAAILRIILKGGD